MQLLLITGLPGTGKSTLAQQLALRYHVPLLGKDLIKEPLFNVLGVGSAAQSRLLSDARFAVLFAVAHKIFAVNLDLILEGNFRPGEHEHALAALGSARMAQVLCRVDEATRVVRLRERQELRHGGHWDANPAIVLQRSSDAFLELPGERLVFDCGKSTVTRQMDVIDRWWRHS